jgi:hypothetical protein
MKPWIPIICSLLLMGGCKSPTSDSAEGAAVADTSAFYPMGAFIREQIEETDINNLPRILRYTFQEQTSKYPLGRDSFLLITGMFDSVLQQFANNKQLYAESILHDLSTNSYTLTYKPLPGKTGAFEYADILLNDQNRRVKRMDIKRSYEKNNRQISEHLSWRTNKGFLISRTITENEAKPTTEVFDVSWEPEKNNRL